MKVLIDYQDTSILSSYLSLLFNFEIIGGYFQYAGCLSFLTVIYHNLYKGNAKKNNDAAGTATLTKDQLRDIREKTVKGLKSEAVVINQGELDRMQSATMITTKE